MSYYDDLDHIDDAYDVDDIVDCYDCDGEGRYYDEYLGEEVRCPSCGGTGIDNY